MRLMDYLLSMPVGVAFEFQTHGDGRRSVCFSLSPVTTYPIKHTNYCIYFRMEDGECLCDDSDFWLALVRQHYEALVERAGQEFREFLGSKRKDDSESPSGGSPLTH